jgi:hypothetical protein
MTTTPPVSVGLATKLGVLFSAIATCAALVAAIAKGDHTPETLGALAAAVAPIYAVIKGRMDQAQALSYVTPAEKVAPKFTTTEIKGAMGNFLDLPASDADPALDDPAHPDDEPEIPEAALEGRSKGSERLEDHTGLGDDA